MAVLKFLLFQNISKFLTTTTALHDGLACT